MSNIGEIRRIVVVGPQHLDTLPKSVLETLKEMGYKESYAVDEREMLGISFARDIEKRGKISLFTRLKKRIIETRIQISPIFELRVYDRLAKAIEEKKPDLIITHSAWIPPQTIQRLKKNTKAIIVSWFPDHPLNLGRQYLLVAPYDFLFFKDKWIVDLARRINKKAFYLPEACMPKWHGRIPLSEKEKEYYSCDVTTAGNIYYYRAAILEEIMKKYEIKLWGSFPRWVDSPVKKTFQGKSVTEEEKSKAFGAAKVVLNTFQGEVFGVNQRLFEIAGCGGFQMCEHRDVVGDFFEIGKEIVTFQNLDDLMEKLDYYMTHPEEKQKIADAAYERAHKEHTFKHRLETMFEIIKNES